MASKPVANFLLRPIIRSSKIISPSILRPDPLLPRTLQPAARRFAHTIPKPPGHPTTPEEQQQARRRAQPHYKITFTCKPCGHRSEHEVSKTGYYHGSVLITCPSCRNRHIISDHLGIFGDRKITVEDLMREKGQLVKRGTLGEYGDIEFWQDKEHFESDDDYYKIKDKPENPLEEADPDVVSEEQEAAKSQETRNPSSQSTDRKPASSALLGDSGTRPSIGDSQHKDPVPSTRRQLSTVIQPTPCKPGVSGRDFLRASMTDGKSYSELHQLLQEYLTGPRSRRVERGLRRALAERRSMLNRVPKEEMLSKAPRGKQ
ncbi:DNL zinc finger-domain-containing protein [Annulohypoxylon maeteangense]|uniref:DNL zinc finger-domain-containing protein n=1 Tax=Annulohypoxylon maeteangense TaxID=1927788 RepID=UPI002008CD68|nr:DNL zinc finger-domain-containing protein [Annulohypoxylon maeteangense]KAI0889619.1 DNL zinc finger-domain-containing protein [Annulohypoxylon maeteangense]